MRPASSTGNAFYIPQLDGLRALAILSVMVFHCAKRFRSVHLFWLADRGWCGVDLFFVLSGFLITGILLRSRGEKGYFRNFYARRALRIWPLYYVMLVVALVIVPIAVGHNAFLRSYIGQKSQWQFWIYAFFAQNLPLPLHLNIRPNPLVAVTWSLAIEEQFYLFWPVAVFFADSVRLLKVLVAVLVASPIIRLLAIHYGVEANTRYEFTIFRLDGLCVGCIIAIILHKGLLSQRRLRWGGAAALATGLIGFMFFLPAPTLDVPLPAMVFTYISVAFGGLLCIALTTKSLLVRLLCAKPLASVGKISYCLYLLHQSVLMVLNSSASRRYLKIEYGNPLRDMAVVALSFAICYLIATASWYLFESRILKLKKYFEVRAERAIPAAGAQPRLHSSNAEAT
jgi:peptidoglycan/LPS O-acetylase OafA/YrhL